MASHSARRLRGAGLLVAATLLATLALLTPTSSLPLAHSILPGKQNSHSAALKGEEPIFNDNLCRALKVAVVPLGWLYGSKLGPPNINSEEELNQIGPYVAPLLYGGLGNQLFQLAAVHEFAYDIGVPCVVGFFNHWNRRYETFEPWGGHTPPVPGITLKDTFPAFHWLTIEPEIHHPTVYNSYAFKIAEPDEYLPMPTLSVFPAHIHGYFFNHRYWHHRRSHVLNIFKLNPAIDEYIEAYYGDLFKMGRETVSVHLRFGYDGEPAMPLLEDRKFPPRTFYEKIFNEDLDKDKMLYLLFSDNIKKAEEFMRPLTSYGFKWLIIDENVVVSIRLMAMCKHHILTCSTLSFWGAYLDPNQPIGGRTFVHSTFFNDHGRKMIPDEYYRFWTIVE